LPTAVTYLNRHQNVQHKKASNNSILLLIYLYVYSAAQRPVISKHNQRNKRQIMVIWIT
jgi:accessory gene regulator protein AgrB